MSRILCILILMLTLTSCGWFSGGNQVAKFIEEEQIPWAGELAFKPVANAENYLYEAFVTSPIAWIPGDQEIALRARNALESQFNFLKDRITLDGSVPYYTYKAAFEFIQFNYRNLESVLDRRVEQNALAEGERIIYDFVKRDINVKLELQRKVIAASEKNINDKASEYSIDQMRRIYETIKPLVGLAL